MSSKEAMIKFFKDPNLHFTNLTDGSDSESEHEGKQEYQVVSDQWGRVRTIKVVKSFNEDLTLNNFLVYKYILCKHTMSCFLNSLKYVNINFINGAFVYAYSFLISHMIQDPKRRYKLFYVLRKLLLKKLEFIIKFGAFYSFFIFLFQICQCVSKA